MTAYGPRDDDPPALLGGALVGLVAWLPVALAGLVLLVGAALLSPLWLVLAVVKVATLVAGVWATVACLRRSEGR